MSGWLLLAVICLSASWQFCRPWAYESPTAWWSFIAAAGVALALGAKASTTDKPAASRLIVLAGAMALSAVVLPWPYGVGSIALAAGALIWSVPLGRLTGRVGVSLVSFGLLHLLHCGVLFVFHYVGPHLNRTLVLDRVCASLLGLVGVDVSLLNRELVFTHVDPVVSFVPTFNNAGTVWVVMAIVTLVVARIWSGSTWRSLPAVAGVMLFVGVVRFVMLVLLAKELTRSSIFWQPWWTAASMVPVYLAGAYGFERRPWSEAIVTHGDPRRAGASMAGLAAVAVGAALLVVCIGYEDPGHRHDGAILIDEYHSDWEWTDQAMDTEWYGQKSTYNFYNMAEFLAKHYPIVRGNEPLTPAFLAKFDTVMLKTPTNPYSDAEVDAIREFVARGGGVILIGDHTNVFGTSEFLNQVGEHYGIEYVYDIQYEMKNGELSLYAKPRLFPHPVTVNMPPTMLFGGSCTLNTTPGRAAGAVVGYKVSTLPIDYSQRSFFPDDTIHQNFQYGVFNQVAAVKSGKGRVVAFTDSTIFSNFFIFIPGKWELAMGLVEWAYRSNRFAWAWCYGVCGGCEPPAFSRRWPPSRSAPRRRRFPWIALTMPRIRSPSGSPTTRSSRSTASIRISSFPSTGSGCRETPTSTPSTSGCSGSVSSRARRPHWKRRSTSATPCSSSTPSPSLHKPNSMHCTPTLPRGTGCG